MTETLSNRPPGYVDARCVICGRGVFVPAGTLYPTCGGCKPKEIPMEHDYQVVEQTEYRGAAVEIRRWEGSRCALYRAHWSWEGDPKDYAADCASTSHTLAMRDAERAIDRKLDGTTDHYSLADLQAQEDAGEACEGDRWE